MTDDYTLMTTESMALVLNDDGCCVRHPSIPLKEYDANGDVFLKEACPECQAEFQSTQTALLDKRRQLNAQLQQMEEEEEELPMDERRADVVQASSGGMILPRPPPAMLDHLTLESLAAQMVHIQQMQDILMFQKDREVSELKVKVEYQQEKLLEKEVEIALLKERLSTQKAEMQKELKSIKRAVAMDRERRLQGSPKEAVRIEQLHVHTPSDAYQVGLQAAQKHYQQQQDESKQADKVAITAKPSSDTSQRSESTSTTEDTPATTNRAQNVSPIDKEKAIPAPMKQEVPDSSKNKGGDDDVQVSPTVSKKKEEEEDLSLLELQVETPKKGEETAGSVKAMAAKLDQSSDKEEFVPDNGVYPAHFKPSNDDEPKKKDESWDLRYIPDNVDAVPPARLKVAPDEEEEEDKSIEDNFPKTTQNVSEIPGDMWHENDDVVESEEEDTFDDSVPLTQPGQSSPLARKPTPVPYKAKPGPLTTPKGPPEHSNEHRKDPLDASTRSLKPPGKLQPPSSALPSIDTLTDNHGMHGIPISEFEVDELAPPMVPLEEQVTISTDFNISDRFIPRTVGGDEGTIGVSTIGPTVASSTYAEDRQKVKDHLLLDPYGDKGVYTGQVLLSTGLPHGSGKMIYEDDGRTYEGDWRHGRWHGWGRATFSNGDSFEGFYKYDQRHGHGKYSWRDGRVYEGDFKEDKRHGKGHFIWPDGAEYTGDFANGQRHGNGRYTFADGGHYVGDWVNGRYEGYGECHWHDGRVYKGEWKDGMAYGQGVETYSDGRVRHSGQWIKDEPIRDQ